MGQTTKNFKPESNYYPNNYYHNHSNSNQNSNSTSVKTPNENDLKRIELKKKGVTL